MADLVLLFI